MAEIFIGTSGFSYSHWKGVFYPQDLPQKDWLRYYADNFKTVEINATFYHQMRKETFENWRKIVGPDFVFSIKGSRFITHIKRLKDCQKEVERFFEAANSLKSQNQNSNLKTKNVVLWQLPPNLAFDKLRLKKFLELLPKNWLYAFEFRNESWLNKEIYDLLKKYNAAIVFQDYPDWPICNKVTTDFVYLRFHGRTSLYSSCYTKKELSAWAKKIKNWLKQGLDVYAYFNNDAMGYAIQNAKQLKELLNSKHQITNKN